MWKEIKKQFKDELELEDNEKDNTLKKIIKENLLIETSKYDKFKYVKAEIDSCPVKDCKIDEII